jgi:hypothetical protein
MITLIIENEHHDRKTQACNDSKFLDVHHDGTITSETYYSFSSGKMGTDSCGEIVSHGSTSGVVKESLPWLDNCGLKANHAGCTVCAYNCF